MEEEVKNKQIFEMVRNHLDELKIDYVLNEEAMTLTLREYGNNIEEDYFGEENTKAAIGIYDNQERGITLTGSGFLMIDGDNDEDRFKLVELSDINMKNELDIEEQSWRIATMFAEEDFLLKTGQGHNQQKVFEAEIGDEIRKTLTEVRTAYVLNENVSLDEEENNDNNQIRMYILGRCVYGDFLEQYKQTVEGEVVDYSKLSIDDLDKNAIEKAKTEYVVNDQILNNLDKDETEKFFNQVFNANRYLREHDLSLNHDQDKTLAAKQFGIVVEDFKKWWSIVKNNLFENDESKELISKTDKAVEEGEKVNNWTSKAVDKVKGFFEPAVEFIKDKIDKIKTNSEEHKLNKELNSYDKEITRLWKDLVGKEETYKQVFGDFEKLNETFDIKTEQINKTYDSKRSKLSASWEKKQVDMLGKIKNAVEKYGKDSEEYLKVSKQVKEDFDKFNKHFNDPTAEKGAATKVELSRKEDLEELKEDFTKIVGEYQKKVSDYPDECRKLILEKSNTIQEALDKFKTLTNEKLKDKAETYSQKLIKFNDAAQKFINEFKDIETQNR